MAARRIFPMTNNYFQGNSAGICTVASLQWAKVCLKIGRGIGNFYELQLSSHQMNALMAVWRRFDNAPAAQTQGMGLRIIGNDRAVNQFIDVQRFINLTPPHICIFWTNNHTMGYRVSTIHGRECEFFDIEDGLWLAYNDMDIRQVVMQNYRGQITGMRIVSL